jgi:hypothetical protein
MSLGSAFLRPQSLEQAPVQGESRAFELLFEFMENLLADPERVSILGKALAETGGEVLPHFLYSRQDKVLKAEGGLRGLFRPFSDLVREFIGGMTGGIAGTLPAVIRAARKGLALAEAESVIHLLREILRIGKSDLDISGAAVEGLFSEWIDGAAARLQAKATGGDLSESALAEFEMGLSLRNLKHLILKELDWPSLDAEALAAAIRSLYKRKGISGILARVGLMLEAVQDLTTPLGKILEAAMEVRLQAGGSVGAAAADDAPPEAPVGAGPEPVCWYASWMLQATVHARVEKGQTGIPPIQYITYRNSTLTPYAMEQVAFHSAWAADTLDFLTHMFSAEKGDWVSNILNGSWDLADLLTITAGKKRIPKWAQWLAPSVLTFLGGLETIRCSGKDDAVYPLTEIGADYAELVLYKRWTWLIRELLLSTLTLINHDPDPAAGTVKKWEQAGSPAEITLTPDGGVSESFPVVLNHNQFHGFCYAFGEVGAFILPAILSETDRENYGFIGKGPTWHMAGCAFGGLAISWPMTYLSLLLVRAVAGQFPDDKAAMILLPTRERYFLTRNSAIGGWEIFGQTVLLVLNSFIEWLLQVVYLYLFTDGNTSGGTFAFLKGGPSGLEFPGFPENAGKAPNKLPWKAGDKHECVQGTMGIWNHYPDNGFAYAYDFNHDAGTEVLSLRDGVIVDLVTGNPNNEGAKNSVEIAALRLLADGDPGAMPAVNAPPGTAYRDGTAIENLNVIGDPFDIKLTTRFPPWWDVNGNFWPGLPGRPTTTMPLHPSAALLPTGSAFAGTFTEDTRFAFLDPDYDRGLKGKAFSNGTKFAGSGILIPAGVVFAPDAPSPPTLLTPMYRAGTTFSPIQATVNATPFPAVTTGAGAPGSAVAAGAKFLDGVDIPALADAAGNPLSDALAGRTFTVPPDCGAAPNWLPALHPATPLYLPDTLFVDYTATASAADASGDPWFNAGTTFVPEGTAGFAPTGAVVPGLPAPTLNITWFTPVVFVFIEFQHGLQNFARISVGPVKGQPEGPLPDLFPSNSAGAVEGTFVKQGRPIMLSGDTGTSMFNHLHVQMKVDSSTLDRPRFTIPFMFADATHGIEQGVFESGDRDGVAQAMTWYVSENDRVAP